MSKELKKQMPKIAYQRFVNGMKVVVLATSLEEANKLFKQLTKN